MNRKSQRFTAKYLDELIAEATVDAYTDSEQTGGFAVMIEENLELPFKTEVLEQEVNVIKVALNAAEQIVAICARGRTKQAIPILDLPLPNPSPKGSEWIEAYRRWCRV